MSNHPSDASDGAEIPEPRASTPSPRDASEPSPRNASEVAGTTRAQGEPPVTATTPAAAVPARAAVPAHAAASTPGAAEMTPAAAAIIRAERIKPKSHRTRWIMIGLGVLAALFITAGLVAPQALYWYDESRYDTLQEDLYDLQIQVADLTLESDAYEALVYQQYEEALSLAPRIDRQSATEPEILPAAAATELRQAATVLIERLDEMPDQPSIVKRLKLRLAQGAVPEPLSWFDVTSGEMIELIGVLRAPVPEPDPTETVTREMIDTIRADTAEATERVEALTVQIEQLRGESEAITGAAEDAYDVVAEAAEMSVQQAETLAEVFVDVPAERDAMVTAAGAVKRVVTADALVRLPDGSLVVDGELSETPEGAELVAVGLKLSRFDLLLERHRVYLTAAQTAAAAQAAYAAQVAAEEEARRQAEEEARRQEQEQQETDGNNPPPAGGDGAGDDTGGTDPGTDADGATDADADDAADGATDADAGDGADGNVDGADGTDAGADGTEADGINDVGADGTVDGETVILSEDADEIETRARQPILI